MIRHIIVGGRQVGKTQQLLDHMLENSDTVYVAHTAHAAQIAYDRVIDSLEERGTTWDDSVKRRFRERFMSWEQAADPRRFGRPRPVVIDNADLMLQAIFGRIDIMTMSAPDILEILRYEGNPDD